ncbi:MAG: alpha/beta hydrolase [Pedosphaera sp.]|nr:alpha/beta hydrolase [Pedosphaera sp.]
MQLNFQTYGTGFPLIVLHGMFGSLDNWQPISRKLGESFQVFALDLRNHGRSPHSDAISYPLMAEDLREFMAAHNLSRAHVMGHSMGGKTAMQFALLHPEQVEKLVVVDIAPKAYPPWNMPIIEALLALDLRSFGHRPEIEAALAPAIPSLTLRQFLLKSLTRDESGAFVWKINLDALQRNYPLLNQRIGDGQTFAGPVLFIRGGRSEYIEETDRALIEAQFPHAEMTTIAGAGHWVHAEAPDEFVRIVKDFLR